MLKDKTPSQGELEIVYIEDLVPKNHLLRKIRRFIDFTFIRELTEGLYCPDNGRPAIDPEILFKMLFIGYLFNIRSERELVRQIEVNIAYRWFLDYKLSDNIPEAATISYNRIHRFREAGIMEQVFNQILKQAVDRGLVGGKIVYNDSTHLKANANKNKFKFENLLVDPKEYMDELDATVDEIREKNEKKPLDRNDNDNSPSARQTKVSTTDPESGYMVRDGKPKGFFYLDNRTVDRKNNIIIDTLVTPGNINDVDPLSDILERVSSRLEMIPRYMGLDAGYYTAPVCHLLMKWGIQGIIGYRTWLSKTGKYRSYMFQYVREGDFHVCPEMHFLKFRTTTRDGYNEYAASKSDCANCPRRSKCLTDKAKFRVIRRHVWEEEKEAVRCFTRTDKGKALYKARKETIERSYADSKELHGFRYCRYRGLVATQEQSYITAVVQNMKKIATVLWRNLFCFFLPCRYSFLYGRFPEFVLV
jgi:transposase